MPAREFLPKDTRPAALLDAIRTVAAGEALLSGRILVKMGARDPVHLVIAAYEAGLL